MGLRPEDRINLPVQGGEACGLLEVGVNPQVEQFLVLPDQRVGREDDDGKFRGLRVVADPAQHIISVLAGHDDVEDDEVRDLRLQTTDRLVPVLSHLLHETLVLQLEDKGLRDGRIIVHHEDGTLLFSEERMDLRNELSLPEGLDEIVKEFVKEEPRAFREGMDRLWKATGSTKPLEWQKK